MPTPEAIPTQLYEQAYIDTMRAWDPLAVERAIQLGKDPDEAADTDRVVDFDLVPPSDPVEFDSLTDVRRALEDQREHLPADAPELLAAKLDASIMFVRATMGEEFDFYDYVRTTMGAAPVPVEESILAKQAIDLEARLQDMGVKWDPADRDTFQEKINIDRGRESTPASFVRLAKESNLWIAERVPGTPPTTIPKVKRIPEGITFAAETTSENGEIVTSIYYNARNMRKFNPGEKTEISTQEQAHAAHLKRVADAVIEGKMSPALGITTEHSPEAMHLKTVAFATTYAAMAGNADPRVQYQAAYSPYSFEVMFNSHIMINTGHSTNDVVRYVMERLPLDPEGAEEYAHILEERRDDPKIRAIKSVYGMASMLTHRVIYMPSDAQGEVLSKLYVPFLTHEQVVDAVTSTRAA